MPRSLYQRVKAAVLANETFYLEGLDDLGKRLSSTDEKMVAAVSKLSHCVSAAFSVNELRLSESFIHHCRQ